MAAKGSLNTTIDAHALEIIIVAAGQLRREVETIANSIRSTCTKMTTNEELVGGDGEEIKAAFQAIADGVTKLERSVKGVIGVLNTKLDQAMQLSGGKTAGSIKDDTKQTANKAGVFAKQ